MEQLRENIEELMKQTRLNRTKYVAALAPNDDALKIVEHWTSKTDTAAREAFKLIDDYLATLVLWCTNKYDD